jgi:phytoene desaturase
MANKCAIILGAGIGGLATAIRLANSSFQVKILEANSSVGGKLNQYKFKGFRFDTGPSLFTLPEEFDSLFTLTNKNPADYITYEKLEIVTKYFFANGKVLQTSTNPIEFAQEANKVLGISENKVLNFLKFQEKNYNALAPIFLDNPIHKFSSFFKKKYLPALSKILNPALLFNLHSVNSIFFQNKEIVQLFDRYGTYNGSNPYQMPSLFNIISHLEHNVGAYFPKNGMYSLAESLYQLALELGVQINLNEPVLKIHNQHKRVISVETTKNKYNSDFFVSNIDISKMYCLLDVPKKKQPKSVHLPKSTSAIIFHWAINANCINLDLHNILFSENYKSEFDYLFNKKIPFSDPTVYIYISSKINPNDAPQGCENWFVMINAPSVPENIWDENEIAKIRKIVLNKIEKLTSISLQDKILNENIITPKDLENKTGAEWGALYGAASNSPFSSFFRHPNHSIKFENLYFVGGTVHPGGGIPLCLKSAKIVSDLINSSKVL